MRIEDRADVREFIRIKIIDALGQCSEKQRRLFDRIYGSPAKVPAGKLAQALDLCERTVRKNEKTGSLKAKEG